jgi:hypothetical protein
MCEVLVYAVQQQLVTSGNLVRQVRRFLAAELGPGGEEAIWLTGVLTQEVKDAGGSPWRVGLLHMAQHVVTSLDYTPPCPGQEGWKPVLSAGLIAFLGEISTQWRHTEDVRRGTRTLWLELKFDDPCSKPVS